MKKQIVLGSEKISYELERKNVKNINLRIKTNGKIYVSANRYVPQKAIDKFIFSKEDLILKFLKKAAIAAQSEKTKYFTENELRETVIKICEKIYPYFEKQGVKYPEIKFRNMVSRWGSCNFVKGALTFNTRLMYAPYECVEYIVMHEFTHCIVANHSADFYKELEKICPNWKMCRKELKEII